MDHNLFRNFFRPIIYAIFPFKPFKNIFKDLRSSSPSDFFFSFFFGNFFFKSDYSNEVCLLGHDLLLLSSSLQ